MLPHLDPSMGVQVTPIFKKWLILIPYFETTLGGKVLRFYAYWKAKFKKIGKSLKTEKTENFLQILILEIFKLDIQISGIILSGILVQRKFWRLVTPNDA